MPLTPEQAEGFTYRQWQQVAKICHYIDGQLLDHYSATNGWTNIDIKEEGYLDIEVTTEILRRYREIGWLVTFNVMTREDYNDYYEFSFRKRD